MPQANPFGNSITPAGAFAPQQLDATGNLLVGRGSTRNLAVVATAVIKLGPGRLTQVINNVGVSGFTLNDCATVGTAAAGNAILSGGTTTPGQIFTVDVPFTTGLVLGTIGGSGSLTIVYD
jgi:hypothetical protein